MPAPTVDMSWRQAVAWPITSSSGGCLARPCDSGQRGERGAVRGVARRNMINAVSENFNILKTIVINEVLLDDCIVL